MSSASASRRTGVLVIRAWIDERSGALRAHVTSQLDIERGAKEQVGADAPDAVVKLVERWLDRFAETGRATTGGLGGRGGAGRDGRATGR